MHARAQHVLNGTFHFIFRFLPFVCARVPSSTLYGPHSYQVKLIDNRHNKRNYCFIWLCVIACMYATYLLNLTKFDKISKFQICEICGTWPVVVHTTRTVKWLGGCIFYVRCTAVSRVY